ncbi:hypothetical protein PSH47_15970 [Pseudoalteromonas sp. CST5]|uniref:hypothetical protein n=1 Tax=unclassified Pseudoalteromonas TaxID=194690 RepID=UPI002358C288|nr:MULTISPECIES: hypothetical protein [unclassified Pseudoalteromonas]MDC9514492.1 hypothetical protein [Pseudoalteromonas sp. CST1]MDC9538938.1 hypothetical protein [Pseudoalteromonas sp. CST3]MDC9543150.1 hypothetical protein [Pseudoalteromonas sp. CST2]MDC9545853.1 hypothetical protein [Pseudoalteromonas sp. CST4]MDC9550631.1 hypothetical protein [Pseudoalteromonas sp. CST5]
MKQERVQILKQALSALKRQAEVVTKSYPDLPERLPDREELVEAQRALKAVGSVAQEVVHCSYSLNIPIPSLSEEQMLAWFEPSDVGFTS